ncbi:hypothetical protein ACF0H5_006590 [Mactra antiquata]
MLIGNGIKSTEMQLKPTVVPSVIQENYQEPLAQTLLRNLTALTKEEKHLMGAFYSNISSKSSEYSRTNPNSSTSRPSSLLTLFTTLKWNKDKGVIFNNTFINWASLKPVVNPVLFTNDPMAAIYAKAFNWEVLNVTINNSYGLPEVKNLYLDAIKAYHSDYYCFANADILFDGGLIKTIVNIHFNEIAPLYEHVFITAKRYNVVNVTRNDVVKRQHIKTLIHDKGELFTPSAEDFFITDRSYPWDSIPEVIVGIPAYDNWLVKNAREKRHLVIDATKTIQTLHQSEDQNHYRSHRTKASSYNVNLLKEWSHTNINYNKGFVDCIERFTDIDNDVLVVRERMLRSYCN